MKKVKKTLNFYLIIRVQIEHVMQQLVFTNISMDLSNLHLIHCLPKVGLHALYMLNSVLFANLYSSQEKGLRTNKLNEEQTFYF